VNWISGEIPDLSKEYKAKVRYRQILQDCRLIEKDGKFVVEFYVFQNVDRGQSIVFYDGEICLGGGVVK